MVLPMKSLVLHDVGGAKVGQDWITTTGASSLVSGSSEGIVGENARGPFRVALNSEGNSLMQKRQVGRLLAFAQFFGRKIKQGLKWSSIVRMRHVWGLEHFVVGGDKLIIPERRPRQGVGGLWHCHPTLDAACSDTAMLHARILSGGWAKSNRTCLWVGFRFQGRGPVPVLCGVASLRTLDSRGAVAT